MKKENITIYDPNNIDEVITEAFANVAIVKKVIKRGEMRKTIEYYNTPCAFDIEASSFYEGEEKRAIMYGWTMDLNGYIILGRTWEEFIYSLERLSEYLTLDDDRRLILYVHNLSYEFQFLRKWVTWSNVFSLSERVPVYALCDLGIEFRCSYILTGYSLEAVGKLLKKYPVQKKVGDLEYSLLRHSGTPLTEKEIGYMVNDVRVVESYIREQIEKEVRICNIPLTKTGYVRRYCRNECTRGKNKFYNYRKLMNRLTLEPDEYKQLKRAFQGGFTHANQWESDKLLTNVASYDFTSSYPAVMVAEDGFPMSKGKEVVVNAEAQFREYLKYYWCLFDVEFIGIEAKEDAFDHIISYSRCWNVENYKLDNGRIVSADRLRTTVTGEDFEMIEKFYNIEKYRIGTFRRYRRGYLPTDFVRAVLELYKTKTELKDVEGQAEFYQNTKELLNSTYGMCVTDICRDDVVCDVDGVWESEKNRQEGKIKTKMSDEEMEKKIRRENNSFNRFLFYPWGVAITSFARRNLYSALLAIGEDYVYSDTDSVKVKNAEKHHAYFEEYNRKIIQKLKCAMDYHELPYDYIIPKTIEGKEKPLGVWDYEGEYTKFKTLGAKRYATEKKVKIKNEFKFKRKGELHRYAPSSTIYHAMKISFTVSGVDKKVAVPYLLKKYGEDKFFDNFEFGLYIPKGYSGKMTHTYIDELTAGTIVDYMGNKGRYYERSSLHLEQCEYEISDTLPYVHYIIGIREKNK